MSSPFDDPVWRALADECGIAADQLGEGASLLSKCSPAYSHTFARAFFALSTGLERTSKLILQVNSRLSTGGFISEREMRALGHDLSGLLQAVEDMCDGRGWDLPRPNEPLHAAIVTVLADFATGGRYYNLDSLAGRSSIDDPAASWWNTVIVPTLKERGIGSPSGVTAPADPVVEALEALSMVRFRHVGGGTIDSIAAGLAATRDLDLATPWVRMRVLQIARWHTKIIGELCNAARRDGSAEVPEMREYFSWFLNGDAYFRSRKTWKQLA